MTSAYNSIGLHNLKISKEAKQWQRQERITSDQLGAIQLQYPSAFYHPNGMIRILLFIATLIALAGVTGLLTLFVVDSGDNAMARLALVYGVILFIFLEVIFIKNSHHYKSGVTEALLYFALAFTIGGIAGLIDFNEHVVILLCLFFFTFAAFRYVDLISTACAMGALAFLVFYELYQMGGVMQQVIPIVFIILFTPLYLIIKKVKQRKAFDLWLPCLVVAEAISLLLIYAAGNYFVVRELSIELMSMNLNEGEDIPFAWLFYFTTVAIPCVYLYFGIKKKDIVLLRVSLVVVAFAVFTFKYYFSMGHHEITFTVGGIILLGISIFLFRYLKAPRYGFTHENILSEKWADMNPEAFIISQTLGGNSAAVDTAQGGDGGSFGGGGSSDKF